MLMAGDMIGAQQAESHSAARCSVMGDAHAVDPKQCTVPTPAPLHQLPTWHRMWL